jgi:hypothetical protein
MILWSRYPGNANLQIGGLKNAIRENGVPGLPILAIQDASSIHSVACLEGDLRGLGEDKRVELRTGEKVIGRVGSL